MASSESTVELASPRRARRWNLWRVMESSQRWTMQQRFGSSSERTGRPKYCFLRSSSRTNFLKQNLSEKTQRMISDHSDVVHEISECREFKCCRGPAVAKHMRSSEIVEVIKPLMRQKKKRGKKKLFHFSELIDVLLKYARVNIDEGGLGDWEEVEDWINAAVMSYKRLSEVC